jgi:chromosome segregation ATPase
VNQYKSQLTDIAARMNQFEETLKSRDEELQTVESKDEIIESLKTEATKLLKEKDDSINALEAEVCNP